MCRSSGSDSKFLLCFEHVCEVARCFSDSEDQEPGFGKNHFGWRYPS